MIDRIRLLLLRVWHRAGWYFLQTKGLIVFGRRVGILGNFHVAYPANVTVGAHCGINHGVFILGHTRISIGNNVIISAHAMLIDAGLVTAKFGSTYAPAHTGDGITIEDNVWIGAGAIILLGVTVGKGSVVGAGAVVTKDVPPHTIVAGVPASCIGRTDE